MDSIFEFLESEGFLSFEGAYHLQFASNGSNNSDGFSKSPMKKQAFGNLDDDEAFLNHTVFKQNEEEIQISTQTNEGKSEEDESTDTLTKSKKQVEEDESCYLPSESESKVRRWREVKTDTKKWKDVVQKTILRNCWWILQT